MTMIDKFKRNPNLTQPKVEPLRRLGQEERPSTQVARKVPLRTADNKLNPDRLPVEETSHENEKPWSAQYEENDVVPALYWWLADNHGGQGSPEYAALSQLSRIYKPGPMESGVQPDSSEEDVYNQLDASTAVMWANKISGVQTEPEDMEDNVTGRETSIEPPTKGKPMGKLMEGVRSVIKEEVEKLCKECGLKEGDEGPGEDRNWRRPADGTRIPMGVVEENEIKEGDEGPGERSRRPDDTRMPMEVVQEQEGGSGCPEEEAADRKVDAQSERELDESKINKWKGLVLLK